ncbi:hypothetical protein F750_0731 [Streptomyces sp. PAMC 26508]|nr:hypothetical protein F750_0731 [Streptomyces sp. PAMC 26508]
MIDGAGVRLTSVTFRGSDGGESPDPTGVGGGHRVGMPP